MKKQLSLIALVGISLLIVLSGCQTLEPIPSEDNTYSIIYEYPGVSQDDLFTSANDWLVTQFREADSVIEYTDKEAGIITGKCNADVPLGGFVPVNIEFKLTINVKDDKARIKLDNMQKNSKGNAIYEAVTVFSRSDYDKFAIWADESLGSSFNEYVSSGAHDTW